MSSFMIQSLLDPHSGLGAKEHCVPSSSENGAAVTDIVIKTGKTY